MIRYCWSAVLLALASTLSAAEPKVVWVHKTPEHFIAAPSAAGKLLYASALGAFNSSALHAVSLDPTAKQRVAWTKSAPYLKLPTVSSPAVVDGKLIFGDGMHQTDGATLHCLTATTGGPLWQFAVPGQLVHLEGAPAVSKDRVYIGGGNAGIIAIDMNKVTLNGQVRDLASVAAEIDKQWQVLMAKYEEEKKKDPDFAIPPSEDALPRPTPTQAWRHGEGVLHVDAAVQVAGDKVLAASAYLDMEKKGKRVLVCLNAADGKPAWETPLKLNPWSGPAVAGKMVLVGGSTIRFDPSTLNGAKGEVVAADLDTGEIRWRKELPGGTVSTAAVTGNGAVFTATDGKVRAFNAATGAEVWTYDAGAPIFAGAVIHGSTVYAADLKAVVHAINLKDGKKLWSLDLRAHPDVKTNGMVYGTPLFYEGHLYVATCSVYEEKGAEKRPNALVCIGE